MNPNDPMVKKFGDILVNTANEGKGIFEKRLRGWLKVIARRKHRGIPPKLIDELTRVNSKTRFQWWTPLSSPSGLIVHGVSKKHEIQWTSRPHLAFYWQKPFTPMDFYLSALIPRLQDPTWVNALRECPGCGKLLLVDVKWENKWCSPQCRKRKWARENREYIQCPGVKNDPGPKEEIMLLECKQIQKHEPYDECQTCQYSTTKKGGK